MKKLILILLFFTGFLQAQTLQNPTYGNTTTNTLKIKTPTTVTTVNFLSTNEADGSVSKITPINVNIPYTPINYSIYNQSIGQHLTGIDTRLGQISSTSAGITQRVYFTADNTTVTAGTFFTSSLTGKGATATGSPPALVLADNTKGYFTKDIISVGFPSSTIAYSGTYSGNLTVSATPTPVATQQRFTVEIYRTNNGGTPIASGVSGAPTGNLGVTVVAILDSGVINLTAGSITNVPVTGILTQNITLNTGERLRYHVSAAKIGAGGGNVTFGVYYGSSYNSYYDVPVAVTTDAVVNKSTVTGFTETDVLNNLNTGKENVINTSTGLISGDSTIATYLGQNSVGSYLVTSKDVLLGSSLTDISVPGHTITQQKTAWLATPNKNTFDYIIVEIGLNDLDPTESASIAIARLQDYITTINAGRKINSKLIIGAMIPCRQRLISLYGNTDGVTSYNKWLAMNAAIMGGASAITGVDGRVDNHTTLLNDGLGNLGIPFDTGDYIHENNLAREIIANQYRNILNSFGFLKISQGVKSYKYQVNGIKSTGSISVPNNDAGFLFNASVFNNSPVFLSNGYAYSLNSDNIGNFKISISSNNTTGYGAPVAFSNKFVMSNVGVGINGASIIGAFNVKQAANINLSMLTGDIDPTAFQFNAFNDAGSSNVPLEFKASKFIFNVSNTNALQINTDYTLKVSSLAGTGTRMTLSQPDGTQIAGDIAPTSGTYTPTVIAGSNISSSSLVRATYSRVGNVITVSFQISATPTTGGTGATILVSLPVNRATSSSIGFGSATSVQGSAILPVQVLSQATNTAIVNFFPASTTSASISGTFQYSTTE